MKPTKLLPGEELGSHAFLRLDSWPGSKKYKVLVIGETPNFFRVRLKEGIGSYGMFGDSKLVPRHAVTFREGGVPLIPWKGR